MTQVTHAPFDITASALIPHCEMIQDEHGLEVSLGLPNAAAAPAQKAPAASVDADSDLTKRLAELKGR